MGHFINYLLAVLRMRFHVTNSDCFPCVRCGLCCQHLELSSAHTALNRGDGVCRHYDSDSCACGIYNSRPALCRVDESYPLFAAQMNHEEYRLANMQACEALMVRFGKKSTHNQIDLKNT